MKKNLKTFIYNIFCENNIPSSKRVFGGLIIIVVLFCTTFSVIKEGMTTINQSIIETELIAGSALLGLSTITNIWSKRTNNTNITKKEN